MKGERDKTNYEVRISPGVGVVVLIPEGSAVDRAAALSALGSGARVVELAEVNSNPGWLGDSECEARLQEASRWMSTEFPVMSQWGLPELSIVTHGEDAVQRSTAVLSRHSGEVVTVGRVGGGAEVEVDDRFVSMVHLELRFREGAWRARDARSRHGTKLNGKRMNRGVKLSHGDEIMIGRTVIRFIDYDEELRGLLAKGAPGSTDEGDADDAAGGSERADSATSAAAGQWRSLVVVCLVVLCLVLAMVTLALVIWMLWGGPR